MTMTIITTVITIVFTLYLIVYGLYAISNESPQKSMETLAIRLLFLHIFYFLVAFTLKYFHVV